MSYTRNIFDRNAYRAQLKRSTDPYDYTVDGANPPKDPRRPDHLNGFTAKHGAPQFVDQESDLMRLGAVLSNDPYYQYPKTNNTHGHVSLGEHASRFPSVQHSRMMFFFPVSELAFNRHDHQATTLHPIHSNNYIGTNTREAGRFVNVHIP